jgi:transcriptional regulator with XRE-family HTH domain
VAAAEITWLDKVKERIGYPKWGCVPKLARDSGVKRRTLDAWLRGTNVPTDPTSDGTLARIAAALQVSEDWLLDRKPGPPPKAGKGLRISPDAIRKAPRRYHRFLYSLADEKRLDLYVAYCDFLDAQQQRS